MATPKEKDIEQLDDKEVDDELASWFGDDEEEEELAASDEDLDEEESSPSEEEDSSGPAEKARSTDDSDKESLEDGTSPKQREKEDNPYAWIDQLDPDLKAKAEALVHRDRSNTGRVAALQSRLDAMSAEQTARQLTQPQNRHQKAVAEQKVEEMTDDELAAFMEDFPSVAKNVQKLIDQRVEKEREEILGQVRPIQEEATRHKIEQEKAALRHNAAIIFNAQETGIQLEDVTQSEAWAAWMSQQPEGYREYARKANTAAEATKVLEDFARYSEEVMYAQWLQEQQQNEAAGGGDNQQAASPNEADTTAARRKQALSSKTPKSRSADPNAGGSYEDVFNAIVDGS